MRLKSGETADKFPRGGGLDPVSKSMTMVSHMQGDGVTE